MQPRDGQGLPVDLDGPGLLPLRAAAVFGRQLEPDDAVRRPLEAGRVVVEVLQVRHGQLVQRQTVRQSPSRMRSSTSRLEVLRSASSA